MGQVEIAGQTPAPGTILTPESQRVPMPALEDVQRALRWAGHYDGAIDGKDGPKPRPPSPRKSCACAPRRIRRPRWPN